MSLPTHHHVDDSWHPRSNECQHNEPGDCSDCDAERVESVIIPAAEEQAREVAARGEPLDERNEWLSLLDVLEMSGDDELAMSYRRHVWAAYLVARANAEVACAAE